MGDWATPKLIVQRVKEKSSIYDFSLFLSRIRKGRLCLN